MIRKIILCLIILSLLSLTGCWDRKEPENLAIVVGFGFDYNPARQMYRIVAQIANPLTMKAGSSMGGGGGNSDKPAYWTVSAWGYTPIEGLNNLRKKVSRQIYYGHVLLEVYSDTLLKTKGMYPLIDALERTRETRALIIIASVKKKNIENVLTKAIPIESINALGIERHIKLTYKEVGGTVVDNGRVFLNKLATPGIEPVAVDLEYISGQKSGEQNAPTGQQGSNKTQKQAKEPLIKTSGISIFHKDKMVGKFDSRETRGYNWIVGKLKKATIIFKYPGQENEYVTVNAELKSAKFKPYFKDGKPGINLDVTAVGSIINISKNIEHKNETDLIKSYNKRFAQVIHNDINLALKKAKFLKSDVFGFGRSFYRLRYKKWLKMREDWPEIFTQLPVNIKVNTKIIRTGLINKNIKSRDY